MKSLLHFPLSAVLCLIATLWMFVRKLLVCTKELPSWTGQEHMLWVLIRIVVGIGIFIGILHDNPHTQADFRLSKLVLKFFLPITVGVDEAS